MKRWLMVVLIIFVLFTEKIEGKISSENEELPGFSALNNNETA